MEAINARLKQLEALETNLYLRRQTIIQIREREDEKLQLRRQEEDQDYLRSLQDRDQEEDELRQTRRALGRASFANTLTSRRQPPNIEPIKGPAKRSRTRAKRTSCGTTPQPKRNRDSLPIGHDGQGKALYTRPSDGKLVYLRCYVAGCGRTTFETVEALRKHVSSPLHKHKMEGVFSSNGHTIELCGEVAPGQEGFDVTPILQSTGVAPIANMTHTELLPPTTTMSDSYSSDIGARFGVQTKVTVHSEGSSSISSAAVSASDLGKAYRTTCVNQDSSTDTRTRAQKAAEAFNGYLSSDSEDEEEGEITAPTASERIDQHIAKNAKPSTSHGHLTGAELYERCVDAERETNTLLTPEVVDPGIKEECRASPSLFLEQSPNAPSWSRLTSYSENTISTEQGVAPGEETSNRGADVSQKRKRAASSLPNTPATSGKRPRISDERRSV